MVDVLAYFLMRYLLNRLIDPNDKLLEIVQIAPKGFCKFKLTLNRAICLTLIILYP